jgi:membrane-bound lytic murein transglycosylase D
MIAPHRWLVAISAVWLSSTSLPAATPPTARRDDIVARRDLAHTAHDVPMTINGKVLSYVGLFQGNLRGFLEQGLSRSTEYLPMIERVFRAEGVPLDLAYVPLVESAFKPTALSRASARGLWQFVQGTAFEHGLKRDWFIDERSDPEKATQAAATYLKTLVEMFDGDWNLALASYNAGPGRVQRAIKQAKTSDFWKLTETSRYLPRETREYVPMILASIIIARNPDRYGFDVVLAPPKAFELVTVPDALDLKYIAEWAGVPVADIQALNPELRRTMTPSAAHDLKVPAGTASAIEEKLAALDPAVFASFTFHTVKAGETVSTIAKRYQLTVSSLRAANDLKTRTRLRPGQRLMIPERRPAGPPAARVSGPSATTSPEAGSPSTYRVRRGDTLSSIARQFGTTVAVLKQLNALAGDDIVAGKSLVVRR